MRTRRKERGVGREGFRKIWGRSTGTAGGEPTMSEAFARGRFVSVTVRSDYPVSGYVCDKVDSGLLLDIRHTSGEPNGYEFLPWLSIELVRI